MCLYYTEHPEKVKQEYFMEMLDLYFSRIYNQKNIPQKTFDTGENDYEKFCEKA